MKRLAVRQRNTGGSKRASEETVGLPGMGLFDRVSTLAARLCRVPLAGVMLAPAHRRWVEAQIGMGPSELEVPPALAERALAGDAVLQIADLRRDPTHAVDPAVLGSDLRFFAAVPLAAGDGRRLGILAVLDHVPRRDLSAEDIEALRQLAALLVGEIELRAAERRHREALASRDVAEEALRREKEFSELLINSSNEGILAFDRELRVTLWNPGIASITGMTPEQALGQEVTEVLPSLAGTSSEAAMRATLAGRESSLLDQRYAVPATGREGWYEAYFSPLYSDGREVIGGIGFLRETTERRRIEDALRQSQKMEAVGQLTGGIAHDFNNMLTVIAGNLELLESKLVNQPRLLRLVNSATLAATRAEKLTQQLLTFSRRQQLRPQPVDFNQTIIGMDDLLHRTVGETVEIRTSLSPELWPALADPNQLETALLNLILNARDAMPAGGQVTIETANVEIDADKSDRDLVPGSYATLAIGDTGYGMSEDVLAHVFEPFFTTKEIGKGTGLGLSQVYGFVKQSQGHVRIESRLGQGTVVRLYLPRAAGAAGSAALGAISEDQYRGSEMVLVAEDDHGVRDFAVSVLRELGYQVTEAPSGEAAFELLSSGIKVDILFTDVVMPGTLNGVELAKAALERRPDLKVLFTSGYTTRLIEKEFPTQDIEMLRKPYRSIDLAERIRGVLDGAAHAVH